MGIETEYGIVQPGRPTANPMLLSSHVVAAYTALGTPQAGHARWDYADEDPLADARGFRLDRASAHAGPSRSGRTPGRRAATLQGPCGGRSGQWTRARGRRGPRRALTRGRRVPARTRSASCGARRC